MTVPQQPQLPAPPTTTNAPVAGDPQQNTGPQGTTPPTTQPATGQQPGAPQQGTTEPLGSQQSGAIPGEEPLGPPGLKALQQERESREALEKQVKELEPLKKLVEAIGGGAPANTGKSEVEVLQERFEQLEKTAAEERLGRLRLEVAGEKGLTPQQAARLTGTTREELAADADALLALFPQAPGTPQQPGTPRPDPTQGARGAGSDLDARIAEAESKGNVREAISLKNQKLLAARQQ